MVYSQQTDLEQTEVSPGPNLLPLIVYQPPTLLQMVADIRFTSYLR